MTSPLVIYPDATLVVPPVLFGPAEYYAAVARYGTTVVDTSLRYDKRRKEVHRYDIADTRGRLTLTVPVSKPAGASEGTNTGAGRRWADMLVSAHGRWWEVHAAALESAYGRTPYFEHYFPKFEALFAPRPLAESESVVGLCLRADAIIRSILGIAPPANAVGTRFIASTQPTDGFVTKYHQLRQDELGFIPGLSVLDLIFNMGPEAPLFLR